MSPAPLRDLAFALVVAGTALILIGLLLGGHAYWWEVTAWVVSTAVVLWLRFHE